MYKVHDGETVMKEKYGSSKREIYFVRPRDQNKIVIVDEDQSSNVSTLFQRMFLPRGYPNSVSKDYLAYQIWDTAQAFCSTITGILATHQVLQGIGVGSSTVSPLAATTTWVVKDGCGHLGKILFASSHGSKLDAYSKKWRLYADALNDAAMCLEVSLPLLQDWTLAVLCLSNVMRAIVGVAGGATRAAMTQHHAIRGNLADVNAKDSAQETAVNLIASVLALGIMRVFGNSQTIFAMLIIFHLVFNYMAVRSVCLRSLNDTRYLQLIDGYLTHEVMLAPCEVNRQEPLVYIGTSCWLDKKYCGFQIKLGCSLKEAIGHQLMLHRLSTLKEVYEARPYTIVPDVRSKTMHVVLRDKIEPTEVLCAYFHAVLFALIVCAVNDETQITKDEVTDKRPFEKVCAALSGADWTREPLSEQATLNAFGYEPSIELTKYVNKLVTTEWARVKKGMTAVGWDINRHLLLTDEWRIAMTETFETNSALTVKSSELTGNIIEPMSFAESLGDRSTQWKPDTFLGDVGYTIEPEYSLERPVEGRRPSAGLDKKPSLRNTAILTGSSKD